MNDLAHETALIETSRVQREYVTDTFFITRYIGAGKLTMGGPYSSARIAMEACEDVPTWIGTGNGEFRSQDSRTLIEKAKT